MVQTSNTRQRSCTECVSFALCALLLTSCSFGSSSNEDLGEVITTNAPTGVAAVSKILLGGGSARLARPSAALGIFSGIYLAGAGFLPTKGAPLGIAAQMAMLQAQRVPTTTETFTLLQELGSVLQVDVVDLLNRSSDRGATLDVYVESLRAVGSTADQKRKELELQMDRVTEQRAAKRKEVSEIDRELNQALRVDDYTTAAQVQERLAPAQGELAQLEVQLDQTEDILARYEDLLEITVGRFRAIEANREPLVAGLKVVEVPGIEDLGIFEEGSRRNRRAQRNGTDGDIFGAGRLKQ